MKKQVEHPYDHEHAMLPAARTILKANPQVSGLSPVDNRGR